MSVSPPESLPPRIQDALSDRPTRGRLLRDAILGDPARRRLVSWLVPLALTVIAGILRLTNLAHPHALAFDETYYVKDAWSLWTLGYEGRWGEDANELLLQGDTSALSSTASFVVHPPLGKWIIALGVGLLGPGSSLGWRLTTALVGTLTVLVVYLVALELSRSLTVATVAGGLFAIDGLAIVMSRTALLDHSLALFILLGVWCVLRDRRRAIPLVERRGADAAPTLWGRVLWRRPWVLAAGVALGAASAVKWSGLYALAGLGIYLVVTDALARRRAGVLFWPADAAFRQGPVTFLLLVPAALLTYLATWAGWFLTAGGYDRRSDANPLIALWKYHQAMYGFHVGLDTPHSYESPAWQWPLLLRPTAIWVGEDDGSCWTPEHCIAVISAIPNPLIWYAGVAASLYLLYRFVRGLVTGTPMPVAFGMPLVGLAVTWLPWLAYPERTIFQFYTIVMLPFLVIALALALRELAGSGDRPLYRRQAGERTVVVFLTSAVALSVFYYPVWTGMMVPYWFWLIHNWMPGWI